MLTGTAPKEALPFSAEQKQVVGQLAMTTRLVASVLLLLGVVHVVGGPISWLNLGAGFFGSLLILIQGVLTCLLGLVMLAVSSDFKYLGQSPQFSGNHLRNAANNLAKFHQVQLGLAILIALVVLVRWVS